jgi:preprotein translocase SecF subunit
MEMEKKRFSFIQNFRWSVLLSLVLILPGLAAMVLLPFGVHLFNFDVDFIGGTVFEYRFQNAITTADADRINELAAEHMGITPSSVRRDSEAGSTEYTIATIRLRTSISEELQTRFRAAMREEFAGHGVFDDPDPAMNVAPEISQVGTSVGRELRSAAILAAIVASLLILVYITVRFEFKMAVATIAVMIHDVLAMLTVFVVFQIPVGMTFIAATLTILGYTINSNIIIFDRVRETRRIEKKFNHGEIVDKATLDTLPRTINTTLTTLLPVVFLIILGVTSVRVFAIPLFAGIACGAYSSIFLSGPIWNMMRPKKVS